MLESGGTARPGVRRLVTEARDAGTPAIWIVDGERDRRESAVAVAAALQLDAVAWPCAERRARGAQLEDTRPLSSEQVSEREK